MCPALNILTTTGRPSLAPLRASTCDCASCAFKRRCCPRQPARKISRSIYELARNVARALAEFDAFDPSVSANALRCCSFTRSASSGSAD